MRLLVKRPGLGDALRVSIGPGSRMIGPGSRMDELLRAMVKVLG